MKSKSLSRRPSSQLFNRRTVVQGLSALGLSACLRPEPAPPAGPFPLGVASGDAWADGAVLWTRYQGTDPLRLWIWEGDGERPQDALRVEVTPDGGGFVSHVAAGLRSGTWHRYRFEAVDPDGVVLDASETGRFRTALAADALETLTFGAVSCTMYGYPFAPLARAGENPALDAFLLLGDVVYTDGSASLEDYRTRWAQTLGSPEYRALRRNTSVVALWDDHEVRNNWDGDSVDRALYANARQAFLEHEPLRRDPAAPNRYWRKLSWGRTADVFVLDARSERNRARGEYLSAEQAAWLTRGIAESRAAFKLVLNSVPIGAFDTAFFAPFSGDMWQAFPEQRAAVLQAIDDSQARGVIWLSGDFHLASVGRVSHPGHPGARALEALVGPGAQSPNVLPSYPAAPLWDFSSGINNYTSFELNPATGEARIRYVDGHGRVFFDRVYRP